MIPLQSNTDTLKSGNHEETAIKMHIDENLGKHAFNYNEEVLATSGPQEEPGSSWHSSADNVMIKIENEITFFEEFKQEPL